MHLLPAQFKSIFEWNNETFQIALSFLLNSLGSAESPCSLLCFLLSETVFLRDGSFKSRLFRRIFFATAVMLTQRILFVNHQLVMTKVLDEKVLDKILV